MGGATIAPLHPIRGTREAVTCAMAVLVPALGTGPAQKLLRLQGVIRGRGRSRLGCVGPCAKIFFRGVTCLAAARTDPEHRKVIAAEAQYRDWMVAALGGDAASYRRLLAALTGHLRAYYVRRVGPATAEDLVQETLIAVHSRRATYDPAQPLTAWVYGIARYKLIDEFRRARRRASVPLEDAGELFAADETEALSARRDVEQLLRRLPQAKQRLVRAVKLDGSSIAEVAQQTGLSEAAVKVGVHRAVKSMGEELGGDRAD